MDCTKQIKRSQVLATLAQQIVMQIKYVDSLGDLRAIFYGNIFIWKSWS